MNTTLRRMLTANGLSRQIYCAVRQAYHIRKAARGAGRYFLNSDDFKCALRTQVGTKLIDLHTADGLVITIRQNYSDASTLSEIFLEDCYVRRLKLPSSPVVIDIGGFIGDFSLYAAKRLNASRVIVCEPSLRNWTLLLRNISNNRYEGRIEPINKAITDGRDVMMNIDVPDEYQCMVSAYLPGGPGLVAVPGISLGQLLRDCSVDNVDLLKIDCEGGEYAILESTPSELFRRIRNIVFEYHDFDGIERVWTRLENVKQRLRCEGYSVHTSRGLVHATRPSN
jgi:FkbM family methyltransferase